VDILGSLAVQAAGHRLRQRLPSSSTIRSFAIAQNMRSPSPGPPPYCKNDNCFVDRRIGPSYANPRATDASSAKMPSPSSMSSRGLRVWMNFFGSQQKLISKTRHGARVTRRYDEAPPRCSA